MGNSDAAVLVPPSRPELNPLLAMLRRAGLAAVELPRLSAAPPPAGALQVALARGPRSDWIVFSGGASVSHWLAAGGEAGPARLCAIGHAAEQALRGAGLAPACAPRQHTAVEIADALASASGRGLAGQELLLLRPDHAGRDLPDELARRGARCEEVLGYTVALETDRDEVDRLRARGLAAVAFANPSAVRVLGRGARQIAVELPALVGGALCAAAGPATAEELRRHGLAAGLTVTPEGGHSLPALAAALVERLR